MGNQKNQTPADKTAEKKMTKYDLKMQARKEAEAREKRQSMITRITALIVLVLVVIVAVAVRKGGIYPYRRTLPLKNRLRFLLWLQRKFLSRPIFLYPAVYGT